ncbi:54S ribosomal protein L25, mitochondrial [Pichia californica]|uniref:54S ribosomal protein L25, mitochondrial n=1 Tax=Pichia californica TaxID=460514 RepID=A0A9P6WHB2_9ASCO|nr:54S ribosomal protein L25, mitochondrial [[Candida] californica]KAG0681345.1 54S ribosomal protein L25, mitochondrial [[Candida] californica]
MSTTKLFNVSSVEAFAKLPQKLQNFFTRYPPAPIKNYSDKPTQTNAADANPFLPNRHPITGKTHEPIYSSRRQSDLYKLAYKFGIADLMPPLANNKKFYLEKQQASPILKGVLYPKGHKWERTYADRKKKIADALNEVDDILIKHRGSKYKKRLERRKVEEKTWV